MWKVVIVIIVYFFPPVISSDASHYQIAKNRIFYKGHSVGFEVVEFNHVLFKMLTLKIILSCE